MPRRLSRQMGGQGSATVNAERSLIPIGTATLLPDAAHRIRHLEQTFFHCIGTWGYREIIPPTFEFLDVLSAGLPADALEKCFKFADWTTGRILVLRPDVTAQMARIVAMGMAGHGTPLRLSYRTTVFRYEPEHAGREREIFQVGVELIGEDTPACDAEILTLLIESLKALGLTDFTVSLGHVGFYQGLLARSGLSESGRQAAELAAAGKDIPKLEHVLAKERVPRHEARVILETLCRYGRKEILGWGKSIAGRDRFLTGPIDRLSQVYHFLEQAGVAEHLLIDLGEFRGFQYYDGLVFDVFSAHLGSALGGGGRYNHLIGRFGHNLPSTGFALDVDRIVSACDRMQPFPSKPVASILVASPPTHYKAAYQIAQALRNEGRQVFQEIYDKSYRSAKTTLLKQALHAGAATLVVMGVPRIAAHECLLVIPGTNGAAPNEHQCALANVPSILSGKPNGDR
ncbi:MAG: ATP phosphoribosyltransferase regulatory subunit [Nitrospirales bacterium]|nr:ATP phosphoribosyltransferase regulatory subunit [Nitrospirales bacterium]